MCHCTTKVTDNLPNICSNDQQLADVSWQTNDQKQDGYNEHSIWGWPTMFQPVAGNPVNELWICFINECVHCCS